MGGDTSQTASKRSKKKRRSKRPPTSSTSKDDSSEDDAIDITDVDEAESFLYDGGEKWGHALKALLAGIGALGFALTVLANLNLVATVFIVAGFAGIGLGIYYLVLSNRAAVRGEISDLETQLEETVETMEAVEETMLEVEWEQVADRPSQPPTGTGAAQTSAAGNDENLQSLVSEMREQRQIANEILETIPEQQQQLKKLAESMSSNEDAVEQTIEKRIKELESVRQEL